jgi:hypothetical protein
MPQGRDVADRRATPRRRRWRSRRFGAEKLKYSSMSNQILTLAAFAEEFFKP